MTTEFQHLASMGHRRTAIGFMVGHQRLAQEEQWGHEPHTSNQWLAILGEEFGKVSAQVNKSVDEDRRAVLVGKLISLIAVSHAWLEESPELAEFTEL